MAFFPITRRRFLASSSLAITGMAAGVLTLQPSAPAQAAPRQRMAALFHEMPFATEASGCDRYTPPHRLGRTAEYLSSLTEEERLRRHPFA